MAQVVDRIGPCGVRHARIFAAQLAVRLRDSRI